MFGSVFYWIQNNTVVIYSQQIAFTVLDRLLRTYRPTNTLASITRKDEIHIIYRGLIALFIIGSELASHFF